MQNYANIDEYISNFPGDVQAQLQKMRSTIQKAAPEAVEAISYGIPTFKLDGNLVHFAGYQLHIGFYPGAGAIVTFAEDLTAYNTSKGTVQFPLGKPIPWALITRITRFRVQQAKEKAELKAMRSGTKKKAGTKKAK
jgi:uncharacterized protein YdhG (YjbR/CyaY superfamily)